MGTIYIEGRSYPLGREGRSLLEVCLSLGFDVPYFCWHPHMHSVGACRQCAVKLFKDANDREGRLVMSCMMQAKDGMRLSIDDPAVARFRAGVIEMLMKNHPHDCPVCDEGGECHLQDMTVMTGHEYRRNRFPKRTYHNQYLGPFIQHEMNRCIHCYRCVRFYRECAGGRDLQALGWHDHVYFGRHQEGVLESAFSGNLVEVCPTGVFTDKTFKRHFTRVWDLQTAPSVCVHCGLGCNTIPGERYGTLRRIRTRYHHDVNGYFLCDRGRFGYEFVNSPARIRQALRRDGSGVLRPISRAQALAGVVRLLKETRIIGLGSPRASLETNFALRKLVGPENFYHGMPDKDLQLVRTSYDLLQRGSAPSASLRDVQESDAVFILGEDPTNIAPLLMLALRQALLNRPITGAVQAGIPVWEDAAIRAAIQSQKGPLFIATPDHTELDADAIAAYRAAPSDLARLGFAIAHEIDPAAPAVDGVDAEMKSRAVQISCALRESRNPLVVSGVSGGSPAMLEAAAHVAWALRRQGKAAKLCFTVPECNSLGVPILPGRESSAALDAVRNGEAETLLIVENDIYRYLNASLGDELLSKVKHVVVLDHLVNHTTRRAEWVLPAATFAEAEGTLVNSEGRAQRFLKVFKATGDIESAWRWLGELGRDSGRLATAWESLDQVVADMAAEVPVLAGLPAVFPDAAFRLQGRKVARQPPRFSGRTANNAQNEIHEPQPPDDPDSPLTFSMEGASAQPPAALIPRYWAPGWNSVQALNKFQIEVGEGLHSGEPGLRLIEPLAGAAPDYRPIQVAPFVPRINEWHIIPRYHIFGSEELSRLSPGIAELSIGAYIGLGPDGARQLGVPEGAMVRVKVEGCVRVLPLQIRPSLPVGLAVLPVGPAELIGLDLPAWGTLEPVNVAPRQPADGGGLA